MSSKKLTKTRRYFKEFKKADAYGGIFPEMFKLRSFSQMKMIKTRLRNRLNDTNLKRLMRIAMSRNEVG